MAIGIVAFPKQFQVFFITQGIAAHKNRKKKHDTFRPADPFSVPYICYLFQLFEKFFNLLLLWFTKYGVIHHLDFITRLYITNQRMLHNWMTVLCKLAWTTLTANPLFPQQIPTTDLHMFSSFHFSKHWLNTYYVKGRCRRKQKHIRINARFVLKP